MTSRHAQPCALSGHRPGVRRALPGAGSGVRRALVAALVAAGLVVGDPLTAAIAEPTPTPPSAADVRDAQRAVTAAQGSVAAMEVRLAQLSAAADDADVVVQRAGERYAQALSDADAAAAAADAARSRSAAADGDAEAARQDLMAFARQMARSGGSVDTIEAVLSADGFQDVAERSAALSKLTGKADETVQTYRAAQLVASTMRSRADTAASTASAAQVAAQAALGEAQQVQADAQAQVAAASAERDTLIGQLAQARATSAEVERARQDELDRQRRARDEDAARAARLGTAAGTAGTGTADTATPAGSGASTPAGGAGAGTGSADSGGAGAGTGTGTGSGAGTGAGTGTGTGGSSSTSYGLGTGRSRGTAEQGLAAVAWAKTQLGKPYVWGASGPDSYDCSGLTMTSWRNAGVSINRTSRDQYKGVLKISYDQLRPGDLVFWTDDPNDPDEIYHVAIWAGDGMIVEASQPGVPLRVTSMRWAKTMPYAGRP